VAEFSRGRRVGLGALADRPEGQHCGSATVRRRHHHRQVRSRLPIGADALGTLEQLKDDKVGLHMIDLGGRRYRQWHQQLVFTILSPWPRNERDRIRERVRDVKRIGHPSASYTRQAPFGYEHRQGRLVPNANEQAALTRAKILRQQEASLREIAPCGLKIRLPAGCESVARMIDPLSPRHSRHRLQRATIAGSPRRADR